MTRFFVISRCLFFAVGFLAITTLHAQEPLVWKLTEGQRLRYDVTKTVALSLPDGETKFNLRQQFELTWTVQAVGENGTDENGTDESGIAEIEQSIGRVQLSLDDPLGKLEFDSAEDEEPGGIAALAGQLFRVLRDHPLRFKLAPNGKISELAIPEEILETVKNSSFEAPLTEFASESGIRRLLLLGVPEFPAEAVSVGETWSGTAEPLIQSQVVELTYKYEGENDASLSRISSTRKVSMTDPPADQASIVDQSNSGEILFDAERGVLTLNQWNVKLRLELPAGNDPGEGTLDQSFKMELVEGR